MSGFQKVFASEIKRYARAETGEMLKVLSKKVKEQGRQLKELSALVKALQKGIPEPERKTVSTASLTPEQIALADGYGRNGMHDLAKKTGLTQRQLAMLLGVSLVSVSKWLSGKTEPRAPMKGAIVELLKLDKAAIIAKLPEDARENRRSRRIAADRRRAKEKAAKKRARKAAKAGADGVKVRRVKVKKLPKEASISADAAAKAVAALMNSQAPISE